jgi:hypothetical protein
VGIRHADHVAPSIVKFGTNFADKRRSLGRCSSFEDSGHEVLLHVYSHMSMRIWNVACRGMSVALLSRFLPLSSSYIRAYLNLVCLNCNTETVPYSILSIPLNFHNPSFQAKCTLHQFQWYVISLCPEAIGVPHVFSTIVFHPLSRLMLLSLHNKYSLLNGQMVLHQLHTVCIHAVQFEGSVLQAHKSRQHVGKPGNCISNIPVINLTKATFTAELDARDRLCGLVVRVPSYRFRGPGSIPGATRYYEK